MLTRQEKATQVENLNQKINEASSVVFANFSGLKLKDMETLRKDLKSKGITLQVVKNSLLKRVLDTTNKTLSQEVLNKPLVVVFGNSEDDLAAPKAVVQFAKGNDSLQVAGGIFESELVDADTLKGLALLPSREELYAKVVGSLASPITRLVRALNYPATGLASVLKQHLDKINQ
jgi:large subunit ribosomal protein L10